MTLCPQPISLWQIIFKYYGTMKKIIFLTFLFIILLISLGRFLSMQNSHARMNSKPKSGTANSKYYGEKIIYNISPVGISEYNDLGMVELDGKIANLITFRTHVAGFDDTERIYSEPVTYLPLRVERDIKMWFKKEYIVESYDIQNNRFTLRKFKDKKVIEEQVFSSDGPINNAVLLPFYLRTIPRLEVGWSFDIRLPEKFRVTLTSLEMVEVPAGKFPAYYFTSQPAKFEIWVSTDELRLPLKIKGLGVFDYALLLRERTVKEAK